jgi:hypothetical protein
MAEQSRRLYDGEPHEVLLIFHTAHNRFLLKFPVMTEYICDIAIKQSRL